MGRRWATCDADALPDWHLAITWKSSPSSRHMYNMPTLVLPLRPYRGTYISYYCMCRCLVSWVWMNSSGGISMYLRAISPRKKPKKGGRVHWSARQLADTNAEAAEAAAISIFNLLTHDINRPCDDASGNVCYEIAISKLDRIELRNLCFAPKSIQTLDYLRTA